MTLPTFRRVLVAAAGFAALSCGFAAPPIKHVFVIVLENNDFETTFAPNTPATYLADTLVRAGALLRQYYGIGHNSLDNYIAMISGIAPDPQTQGDCRTYDDFAETGLDADHQPIGHGCVYPSHVATLANQLAARQLTWKGYMEDMGKDSTREQATCGHPMLGGPDRTEHATANDQYAAKHDPFVYFHAILDDGTSCQANVVSLDGLEADLRFPERTPSFSFIVPNLCHDGHDAPCVDHQPGGLVSANQFLALWVPRILHAPAFADGLLIITFDETNTGSLACCNEQAGPNTKYPGLNGPGGGRVGAVLLSPFIAPGTVSDVAYNHYSLLRSIEDLFGLSHLGYAGQVGLAALGGDVYSKR